MAENLTTQDGWDAFVQRHGGAVGVPKKISPDRDADGKRVQDPFYHYEFADGTTVEISATGEVKSLTEKKTPAATDQLQTVTDPRTGQPIALRDPNLGTHIPLPAPQTPPGWTEVRPSTNNGVTTYYGRDPKDGQFRQVPGLPTETAPGKPTPTPTSSLDIVRDPTTNAPVAYRDPATGATINLDPAAKPEKPQIIDGPNGARYSWDGKGEPKLLIAGTTPDVKPIEGARKPAIIPGTQYVGESVYKNGEWQIDPTVPPKPYVPTDKPIEGAVRPNTDNKGQAIQEVYKGGSWVTDTSVAPKPFGTQAPTTLNTGTAPYIVQQTPEQAQRGETTNLPNPNTTDVAARVGQLQTAARSKRDQLQQAVTTGTKSPEDAAAEFDTWWSTNVDPVSQQLQRTQQQSDYDAQSKQREQQRLEQEAQRAAYSTAEIAGQDAVKNATNFGPGVEQVGPGYAGALSNILGAFSSGKAPGPIDASGLTWQAPDLNELARKATADALAHISPTAASIAGKPMPQVPQGYDVAGALNKTNYSPRGTTLVHPDGTVEVKPPDQPQPQIPPYMPNTQRGSFDPAVPPQSY